MRRRQLRTTFAPVDLVILFTPKRTDCGLINRRFVECESRIPNPEKLNMVEIGFLFVGF